MTAEKFANIMIRFKPILDRIRRSPIGEPGPHVESRSARLGRAAEEQKAHGTTA